MSHAHFSPHHLTFIQQIGIGACCRNVWKVRCETNEQYYAVKVLPNSPESHSEIALLSSLSHHNILEYIGSYETQDEMHIVTEYCSGGSLKSLLTMQWLRAAVEEAPRHPQFHIIEEHQAAQIFRQIVQGVQYLHENLVCHRDLKLGNILVREPGEICIADFGISERITRHEEQITQPGGTLHYLPPEFFTERHQTLYSDLWSLGVVLYVILSGVYPFRDETLEKTQERICRGDYHELPLYVSEEARDLVHSLLQVEALSRADCATILEHAFLAKTIAQQSNNEHTPLTPLRIQDLSLSRLELSSKRVEIDIYGQLIIHNNHKNEQFMVHRDGWRFSMWRDGKCLCLFHCISFAPLHMRRLFVCAQRIADREHQDRVMFEMRFGQVGDSCRIMHQNQKACTPNAQFSIIVNQQQRDAVYRILYLSSTRELIVQSPSPVRTFQLQSDLLQCGSEAIQMLAPSHATHHGASKNDHDSMIHANFQLMKRMKRMLRETLACCPFVQ